MYTITDRYGNLVAEETSVKKLVENNYQIVGLRPTTREVEEYVRSKFKLNRQFKILYEGTTFTIRKDFKKIEEK